MKFDLTDEVRNQIIFSMEDQGKSYVFDSVELKTIPFSEVEIDNDRYYKIPEWGSMDGFHLMERFVALLRNPLARESLRSVLFSGLMISAGLRSTARPWLFAIMDLAVITYSLVCSSVLSSNSLILDISTYLSDSAIR